MSKKQIIIPIPEALHKPLLDKFYALNTMGKLMGKNDIWVSAQLHKWFVEELHQSAIKKYICYENVVKKVIRWRYRFDRKRFLDVVYDMNRKQIAPRFSIYFEDMTLRH